MTSQTEKAYYLLKSKIVNLELPPGSVLKENELMAEMGFGRTPMREALQRLARDDLVVIQPRRGMYVSEVGVKDLKQIFEARLPIEMWCARLAAERMTPAQLALMEAAIARVRDPEDPDYLAYLMESDRSIHGLISEATGNKFLIDGVRWLYDLTARIWKLAQDNGAGASSIHDHHRLLYEALKGRDADRAEQIMREHVLDFWSYVRSQV